MFERIAAREWTLWMHGDALSSDKMESSRKFVLTLGYFESVNFDLNSETPTMYAAADEWDSKNDRTADWENYSPKCFATICGGQRYIYIYICHFSLLTLLLHLQILRTGHIKSSKRWNQYGPFVGKSNYHQRNSRKTIVLVKWLKFGRLLFTIFSRLSFVSRLALLYDCIPLMHSIHLMPSFSFIRRRLICWVSFKFLPSEMQWPFRGPVISTLFSFDIFSIRFEKAIYLSFN